MPKVEQRRRNQHVRPRPASLTHAEHDLSPVRPATNRYCSALLREKAFLPILDLTGAGPTAVAEQGDEFRGNGTGKTPKPTLSVSRHVSDKRCFSSPSPDVPFRL